MAMVAGVLLAVYMGVIVFAIAAPTRGPDPQRGQAVGCLMLVAVGLVLLGGLLGLSVALDWQGLVTAIAWIVIFPTALMLPNGVYFLLLKIRQQR